MFVKYKNVNYKWIKMSGGYVNSPYESSKCVKKKDFSVYKQFINMNQG